MILIVAGIAAAAVLVKYAGFRAILDNAFLGFAADFMLVAIVLMVVAGPAYWRRTRRGLDTAMKGRACKSALTSSWSTQVLQEENHRHENECR